MTIFDYIHAFKDPRPWSDIVVHHSLTADGQVNDWEAIRRYHTQQCGWQDIGYHAGIELIGDRLEYQIGRPLDMVGAHTLGMNEKALGICVVGNFDLIPPTDTHLFLLASLCRAFMDRFGIKIEHINFHRDYADKTCPGTLFSKIALRNAIRGIQA